MEVCFLLSIIKHLLSKFKTATSKWLKVNREVYLTSFKDMAQALSWMETLSSRLCTMIKVSILVS